jgi:hypothetical protein
MTQRSRRARPALRRPFRDDALRIVASGERKEGAAYLRRQTPSIPRFTNGILPDAPGGFVSVLIGLSANSDSIRPGIPI